MQLIRHAAGTVVAQGRLWRNGQDDDGTAGMAESWPILFGSSRTCCTPVGCISGGTTINIAGSDPSRAKNFCLQGITVHSMVLEVPDNELLADAGGRHRIGVWAVSTLATTRVVGVRLTASGCR